MKLFALADLHLPGGQEKPMDIFDPIWRDHPAQIAARWRERVGPDDLVLVPGDISWAMTLEEAADDLAFIGGLPGRKLLLRGNHDYWWSSISKVRAALPEGVHALQNDCFDLGDGRAVCGTRGWLIPGSQGLEPHDEKVYQREAIRLRLSLEAAAEAGLRPVVAMMHYPPCDAQGWPTLFTRLLEEFQVPLCVYGHLHGPAAKAAPPPEVRGVRYQLVAADYVRFEPVLLNPLLEGR
ncbi:MULTISPECIES: metallophosphoesterase [Limnochorda]|uniref:metallophosphoesterase n=1 Tax=Limnochorda TaxID=1676651 RepID=UPI0018140BDE|nr:metallophosphoesterase [Limnochorda pilosa]MBO2486506.1 phosphohydrolase [Bacillota bacterium]MBO2519564.1 phosphohydrolase [Bacillota bacterium]NMA70458.1 phosphohydrolase [Bacillota bacterium]